MSHNLHNKSSAVISIWREEFESALNDFIKEFYPLTDTTNHLNKVITYVLRGKGKRVRPILAMLAAEACGVDHLVAIPAGVAVELVHAYSLVHDDLPCMDNDDMRRGLPTAHRAFDEASALLAGDALLTDAFAILAKGTSLKNSLPLSADTRIAQVAELSKAAGSSGMVLGQILDLYWTGRGGAKQSDLDTVHLKKTGCLIGAACAMGALCGDITIEKSLIFREFGLLIGLAFQITDDLLDETSETGKTVGKDRATGKLTYLASMSESEAREAARYFTRQAHELLLKSVGEAARPLILFSDQLLARGF
jgi:geranylgeranyl pyrophosphate synthase